jgi:hypothetical protein
MGYPPVVVVESGGVPRTQVEEGVSAPAFTVVESGARPITLADNAPPIALFNPDGSPYGDIDPLEVLTSMEWDQVNYPLAPAKVDGVWESGFDPDDYLPLAFFTGTPLFCDFATGNDANNGTAGQPVKSLWRLINLINASADPVYAEVTGGPFPRANWFNNLSVVVTVKAWINYVSGGRGLAYNGDVLSWSADGSFPPNNWNASRPNVARVIDLLAASPYGNHYRDFAKYTTSAEVQSGGFADPRWAQISSNTILTVNRGGGVLNANTRALLTTNGLRTNTSLRLSNFNIEGGGGAGGAFSIQNVTDGVVIAENCSFRYAGSDAVPRDNSLIEGSTGLFAFIDCEFDSSSKDGLNHTRTDDGQRLTFVLTERCRGADFGRGASTSNNAITGHQMTVQVDFNNQGWEYGRLGTVRFIDDTRLAMFGGRVAYDLGDGSGFTPAVVRADDTAEIWLIDVEVESVASENTLLTTTNGVIHTHNVTQTGGSASGDIRPF